MTTPDETSKSNALESELFGDLSSSPAPAISEGGATSAAVHEAEWPTSVPSTAVATEVLSGTKAPHRSYATVSDGFRARLSPVENAALSGAPLGFDAAALANAVAMRWRIKVAIATRPSDEGQLHQGNVDVFLHEVDDALKRLATVTGALDAASTQAVASNRDALARAAIDILNATPTNPTLPAVTEPPPAERAAVAGKVRFIESAPESAQAAPPGRQRVLVIVMVVAVIAAAIFHGSTYLQEQGIDPRIVVEQALGGATASAVTPGRTVVVIPPHLEVTDATLQKLRAQAKSQNLRLFQRGSHEFIIANAVEQAKDVTDDTTR